MLDLNTGIHFHKVMPVSINDTLKGRDRIKANSFAKSDRFIFHALEDL